VVLFLGSPGIPERCYCEIRLEVPGKDHFVKKNAAAFETAVIEAVDVLQGMIRKTKEKQLDRNQGGLV
jgi:ribosome-associated translation inhibitor RaiA